MLEPDLLGEVQAQRHVVFVLQVGRCLVMQKLLHRPKSFALLFESIFNIVRELTPIGE